MDGRVYLDYAATAPLRPEARARMVELLNVFGNASSIHADGQAARAVLDDARRFVADALGVRAERVVFTSGGTEANNLVLRGFKESNSSKTLLVSAVEHDCVRNTGKALGAEEIPVTEQGILRLDWLSERVSKGDVGLVSVMHANNENGILQPVEEIAKIVHAAGGVFHTDAVQTVGHQAIDVDGIGADFLTFSGHKFGGPKGVGVLVLKAEIPMVAAITGGSQERNRRAGTENVLAIGGMRAALAAALDNMDVEAANCRAFHATMAAGLEKAGFSVVGAGGDGLGHILQVLMPGKRGDDTVIAMDLKGVSISQGSACGSGRVKESHVLRAMGFDAKAAGEAVRLSWGWSTTMADIEAGLAALTAIR